MADMENGSNTPAGTAGAAGGSSSESPNKKQKQEASATAGSPPPGKFKIATRVVMAMKRFQASLNPTYSYGKRTSDSSVEHTDGHRVLVQPKAAGATSGRTTSGRTASGRTLSGRPTSAGQHHGYKANLLFRPLPKPDTAVESS